MGEIRIGICEPSKTNAAHLITYLRQMEESHHLRIKIDTFQNASELINCYTSAYNIIFSAYQLPDLDGAQLLSLLCRLDEAAYLIFLLPPSVQVPPEILMGAKGHLVRPLRYVDVQDKIFTYLQSSALPSQSFFWYHNRKETIKLFYKKLRFLETEKRQKHVLLHYDGRIIPFQERISHLATTLPQHLFFQCSKSYIVNMSYIKEILPDMHRYQIYLLTGEIIPLSRERKKPLLQLLQEDDLVPQ